MNTKIKKKNISIKKFIKIMKRLRKKEGEYMFQGIVNDKLVALKGEGTHNRFFIVDCKQVIGAKDLDIPEWINELERGIIGR